MATISASTFIADTTIAIRDILLNNMTDPITRTGNQKFVMTCVDEETECLTIEGWKRVTELKELDSILSFNIQSQTYEEDQILGITYGDYSGEVYEVDNKNLKMLVTPNHRVLVNMISNKNKYKLITPDKINKNHKIPIVASRLKWEKPLIVEDNLVQLIGWILAEGHIYPDGGISIYQSDKNIKYVNEIKILLQSLNLTFSEYTRLRKYALEHDFYIHKKDSEIIQKYINNKELSMSLLTRLTLDQLNLLFETLIKGDGSIRKDGRMTFIQKDKKFMDNFQILCFLLGKKSTIYKRENVHYVNVGKAKALSLFSKGKSFVKRKAYTGKVWCPRTKNGTWIARRNNHIFVTGNSYPERDTAYPLVTVIVRNISTNTPTGFRSEVMGYDMDIEIRVWARNMKEMDEITDQVITQLRTRQIDGTSGTIDSNLFDMDMVSSVVVAEEGKQGVKSRVMVFRYLYIAG